MGTYKCPLALMPITQVGKHLMDLDVCTGKEGKGGLCYENTLIENTFLDPTTRNVLNTSLLFAIKKLPLICMTRNISIKFENIHVISKYYYIAEFQQHFT